jgi:hypothetical protein
MPVCHFPVYNSLTGLCEKHNTNITNIVGVSGFCPDDPNHVIMITSFGSSATDVLLNTLYTSGLSNSNTLIQTYTTSSSNEASQDVNINTNINDDISNMYVTLTITIINPVVKADYKPLDTTKKTDVVKKV